MKPCSYKDERYDTKCAIGKGVKRCMRTLMAKPCWKVMLAEKWEVGL